MKKVFAIVLCLLMVISSMSVFAYNTGDDYPTKYKFYANGNKIPKDEIVDEWNFYNRNCTSFVAWCLNSRNGVNFTNQYLGASRWGHAKTWGTVAQQLGVTVNKTPAVGAVAWWNTDTYGHVAWVKTISGANVVIEEYNYETSGEFGTRTISASNPTGYIHIKDINVLPPTKPTITGVYLTNNKMTVEWTAAENATGYNVDFWNSETNVHTYYQTSGTSYTIEWNGEAYAPRVESYNSGGSSGFTGFYYADLTSYKIVFDGNGGQIDSGERASYSPDSVNGNRGADQMVIFNNSGASTGTNKYGTEVFVDNNGLIIDSQYYKGNGTVPSGGFIISGHGLASSWLGENANVGNYAFYNSKVNKVTILTKNQMLTTCKSLLIGNFFGELPIPMERENLTFDGWYTESEGGDKVTADTKFTDTTKTTLYAHWNEFTPVAEIVYDNHQYLLFDNSIAWKDAEEYCESMGGYLATITSEDENLLIKNFVDRGEKTGYWLGATDELQEGVWQWITGEEFNYTDWYSDNPNNTGKREHYLEIRKDYGNQWNDDTIDKFLQSALLNEGFICEIELPHTDTVFSGELFTVTVEGVAEESSVILSLYSGNCLVEVQKATYNNGTAPIEFTPKSEFDSAKVMLWNEFEGLKPLSGAECMKFQ